MKSGCVVFPCSVGQSQIRQYSLGGLYYRGQGVTQNYSQAFNCTRNPQSREIPMPVMKWRRWYQDGIGVAANAEHSECCFEQAFPVSAGWKRRVMMTSCSTAWGRCCIQEPVRERMTEQRKHTGNGPHSLEM